MQSNLLKERESEKGEDKKWTWDARKENTERTGWSQSSKFQVLAKASGDDVVSFEPFFFLAELGWQKPIS